MLLGIDTVPALRLSHLTEAERRAYVLADNKLALNAGWDREMLAIGLQGLVDLVFDIECKPRSISYWTRHARAQPTVRILRSKT
jgi:hypothetical protein